MKELDQWTILSLPSTLAQPYITPYISYTNVFTTKYMGVGDLGGGRGVLGGAAGVKRGESSGLIAIQVSPSAAAHCHPNVQRLLPNGKYAYRLHMYICLISAGFWRMRRLGLDYFFFSFQMALFPPFPPLFPPFLFLLSCFYLIEFEFAKGSFFFFFYKC